MTKDHQRHVQDLWQTCKAFLRGRLSARYLAMLPAGAPFAGWSHHDRYAHRRHFNMTNVDPHRQAAQTIRGMVQQLTQDGLL